MGKPSVAGVARARSALKPSVLVVDEGRAFGQMLVVLLVSMGSRALSTTSSQLADAVAEHRPDALLLDGRRLDKDLVQRLARVRQAQPHLRAIALVPDGQQAPPTAGAGHPVDGWATYFDDPAALVGVLSGDAVSPTTSSVEPSRRGPLAHLTAREMDVLRRLVGGASNADIADALAVSPNTIRTHVQNLFNKLDVHSRLEAVTVARDAGLGSSPLAAGLPR